MQSETLCWTCANAVPGKETGCSWSRSFKPVQGWKAKRRDVKYKDCRAGRLHQIESYEVRKCPEYKPDILSATS